MTPFAFYGRVSTEDQQDPKTSREWQLARSESLIAPHAGEVVAEYFDIGMFRSLPWRRRPQATALLQALRDPDRGFVAVVIGEPARAFYGHQFSLTFPVFVHYGVQLWVPEVGGAVDPGSDAHDLVMSLYAGCPRANATASRSACARRWPRRPRPRAGSSAAAHRMATSWSTSVRIRTLARPRPGQRQHGLAPDPVAAQIVRLIFREYVAGKGLYAIAEGLTRDGIACPSAHDPARNRHRDGAAWSKSAVRAILRNPRYTGRQVWNRQRREEVLVDVDDVALGHETRQRWNPESEWIWSAEPVHEPLITPELFAEAQRQNRAGRQRAVDRKPRTTRRPYALRRLLTCGLCGRKMQGSCNGGRAHYRCRYPIQYALANRVEHPKSVYVPEDAVLPRLDAWLGVILDPATVDATVAALAAVDHDNTTRTEIERCQRALADCEQRLARYRAALEAGTDPTIIAQWTSQVQAEQARAQRGAAPRPRSPPAAADPRRA
jgi:hypothetical protein